MRATNRRRPGIPLASSPAALHRMMSAQQRDTKPELAIRRILHRQGLRYRVDFAPIGGMRGRADIVFSSARVAVYIDGCFWHGCPAHGTWPKANGEWWRAKIEANRRRDQAADRRLAGVGWRVIRVWEHDEVAGVAEAIVSTVTEGREGNGATGRARPSDQPPSAQER